MSLDCNAGSYASKSMRHISYRIIMSPRIITTITLYANNNLALTVALK